MSPSHTNKRGARYRYYVSQAVLANKPEAAGAIGRVPAAEIEFLIIAALRHHLQANGVAAIPDNERELVERHIERAIDQCSRRSVRQMTRIDGVQSRLHAVEHLGGKRLHDCIRVGHRRLLIHAAR